MTAKQNLSRLARLEAGSRLSLPGQDPARENELRIEFTRELQPQGPFEKLWVEDLAYRTAMIEVTRAQIAGYRMRLFEAALADLRKRAKEREGLDPAMADMSCFYGEDLTPVERFTLERFDKDGMFPAELTNWLSEASFASLLGSLDTSQIHALRQLQALELEDVRERDRCIRQFERRRRQAAIDAVKIVEAGRQSKLAEAPEIPALNPPPAEANEDELE